MSDKKTKKPVMGYDPLAWLKPEENEAKEPEQAAETETVDGTENAPTGADEETPNENSIKDEEDEVIAELNNTPEVDVVVDELTKEPTVEQSEMDNESPEAESTPSTSENVLEIKFESRANISQTEELYKSLRESLTEHQHIKFDASEVEVVDTAILQLLVCFIQEVKNIAGSFEWSGISESFVESAKLINVDQKLDIAI